MEQVEAYKDIREMTPEVLLQLTQSHKLYSRMNTFTKEVGLNMKVTHSDVLVTEEEIQTMGDTLKMIVFFVSPHIMRSTMELALRKGVLLQPSRWL